MHILKAVAWMTRYAGVSTMLEGVKLAVAVGIMGAVFHTPAAAQTRLICQTPFFGAASSGQGHSAVNHVGVTVQLARLRATRLFHLSKRARRLSRSLSPIPDLSRILLPTTPWT